MKKLMIMMVIGVLVISIAACGDSKPSVEEVKAAIENGTLTVEDAIEKGWITSDDIASIDMGESIPAENKLTANMLGDFQTSRLDGTSFTNKDLSDFTYLTFINPNSENAKECINVLTEKYDEIKNANAEVIIFLIDFDNTENAEKIEKTETNEDSQISQENVDLEWLQTLKDLDISVLQYNDSVKNALGANADMVKSDGFTGTWNVGGAFPLAWSMKIDAEDDFIATLNSLKEMYNEK